jgi:hypothetical protein
MKFFMALSLSFLTVSASASEYVIEFRCNNFYKQGIISSSYKSTQMDIVYHGRGDFDHLLYNSIGKDECVRVASQLDQAVTQVDASVTGEMKAVCKSAGNEYASLSISKDKLTAKALAFSTYSASRDCSDIAWRLNDFFKSVRAAEGRR